MTTKWTGASGTGSREYDSAQYRSVVERFKADHSGRARRIQLEGFARACGVKGRTVRAILTDADGVDLLYCFDLEGQGGIFAAAFFDEAEYATANLAARAKSLTARIERRVEYARSLPRQQGAMFP